MKGICFDTFEELFYYLSDAKKIELWNECCKDCNCGSELCEMAEIDTALHGCSPTDILIMTQDDFNINDKYFYFDGCNNVHSVRWVTGFFKDSRGDLEGLYEWLERNGRLREFSEVNDPDYDEADWEDQEDEEDE